MTATTDKVKELIQGSFGEQANGVATEHLRQLLRERCRNDLWFFAFHVLEMHDMDTELHRDMAAHWMARVDKPFSLWQVPRGHLKTSLWTLAGSLWELVREPDQRILIVSATLHISISILSDIRNFFETREIFRWLFPEYCRDLAEPDVRRRCKWLNERIDIPCSKWAGRREGNIEVMGIESSLVSKHFDLFLFDDPVNEENTTTRSYRNKIEQLYRNALQLRHSPKSRVRLIGTRWHYDDLYSRIINRELKARAAAKENGEEPSPLYWLYTRKVVAPAPPGKGKDIAGFKNVLPIWPERFSKEEIEYIKRENGSFIFSCQYLNDPLPEDSAIFKPSQIKIASFFDIPDNVANFMAVDLAASEKDESDYSAVTVASFDEWGRMFVRKIVRQRMTPSRILDIIVELQRRYRCQQVAIETQTFQQTILRFYQQRCVEEGWSIPWVEMTRGSANKARRFLALQPRVERGDFYIEEGIDHADDLIEEMTRFSLDHLPPFDDILDTVADLEVVFYRAPHIGGDPPAPDTWDGYYGSVLAPRTGDEYVSPRGASILGAA